MKIFTKISTYLFAVALLAAGALVISPASVYAADVLSSSTYIDADDNGTVDHLKWTFDTNITACAYEAGDWIQITPGDINLTVTGINTGNPEGTGEGLCNGSDAVVYLTVTADAGETGGSVDPVYTYSNQGTLNDLQDSGNISSKVSVTQSDDAEPLLTGVVLSSVGNRNRISFSYSEIMQVADGASAADKGDLTTSGTVGGFGSFLTTGDVTVPTTLNTVGGNGTSTLYVDLADQAGSYMNSGSTTEPSGTFTPAVFIGAIQDANGNTVNTGAAGVAPTGGGSWDLGKPTLTSITVYDAVGSNGQIDQALIIFSEAVRDANITDADATLGSGGTTTGAFTTGGADDNTTTFDRTVDDNGVDTSASAGEFLYSGATTLITDLAGNLLDTATDGQIALADIAETDAAAPIVVSRVMLDTDQVDGSAGTADGQLDGVLITFSEAMDASSVIVSDFAMTTSGDGGLTEAYADTTDDATLFFGVTDSAADDTADLIKSQITGSVLDLNGNPVAADGAGVSSTDGAAPVYVSSQTIDNNNNGTVDFIQITYSEAIDDSSVSGADFEAGIASTATGNLTESYASLTPASGDLNDVADDALIYVGVTNGTESIVSNKTDYTLLIEQVGNVADLIGNGLASFSQQTSSDGAYPLVSVATYEDASANGTVDTVVLNFTENVTFAWSDANWNFGTPGVINLGGDFTPGDCTGTGTSVITCYDADNSDFTADPNKTGANGGIEPVWNYTSSGQITDGLQPFRNANITLADNAAPLVIDADLDYNDNVSNLVVTFTEEVSAASSDETFFHINDITGTDDITLSQATVSADGASLTYSLTEAERIAALLISGVTGGDGGAVVLDVDAGAVTETGGSLLANVQDDNNTVVEAADIKFPVLTQWDIDFNTNQFTLTFDETVDAATLAPTAITIQDAATAVNSYNLTGGSTASGNGTVIVLDLAVADINALKADPNLATSSADAFLVTTIGLINDVGQNDNASIIDGAALQANSFAGSASIGTLTDTHLLLSNNYTNTLSLATVRFVNQTDLPADAIIEIIFPASFSISGVASTANPFNIDGTFAVVSNGSTVTVTRQNDGSIITSGTTVGFNLPGVINPNVAGTTDTFTFRTKTNGSIVIDEDTAVAGQTIIVAPAAPSTVTQSSGGGGGGGYVGGPTLRVYGLISEQEAEEDEGDEEGAIHEAAPAGGTISPAFTDIFNHWAKTYIEKIAALGIVQGKTSTRYAPNDNISRAELLKIAMNTFGYTVASEVSEDVLPDVKADDWFAPFVKSALENEVIYGFAEGLDPNSPASRGMAATVLAKAAGFDEIQQNFDDNYANHAGWTYAQFPDIPMNAYHAPFIVYLYKIGVISGYEDGNFGPGNPITRGEIAKIVVNLIEMQTPVTSAASEMPAVEEAAEPANEESAAAEPAMVDAEMMDGQGLEGGAEAEEVPAV